MPLINYKINFILIWIEQCINSEGPGVTTLAMTVTTGCLLD